MFNVTLSLDPASRTPMYEQLYRYFVSEIHAGRLSEGEKLPSKRALCAHLGVSRSTVETAYGLLAAEGYILSRAKSGCFVSDFVAFQAPEQAARLEDGDRYRAENSETPQSQERIEVLFDTFSFKKNYDSGR